MKKILTFCSLSLLLNSCTPNCDPFETERFLVSDSNKAYILPDERTDIYINNKGETTEINFDKVEISLGTFSDDHSCGYSTFENVRQIFKTGNYLGNISIGQGFIDISISDYAVRNQFQAYSNQTSELDDLTTDVVIAGFSFTNVIELTQQNNTQYSVWDMQTIIYSKENGIELIVFRDNTWLKKVIN